MESSKNPPLPLSSLRGKKLRFPKKELPEKETEVDPGLATETGITQKGNGPSATENGITQKGNRLSTSRKGITQKGNRPSASKNGITRKGNETQGEGTGGDGRGGRDPGRGREREKGPEGRGDPRREISFPKKELPEKETEKKGS